MSSTTHIGLAGDPLARPGETVEAETDLGTLSGEVTAIESIGSWSRTGYRYTIDATWIVDDDALR